MKNKTHYFIHAGKPRTLCGISDRDGIIFEDVKRITCKKHITFDAYILHTL